MQRYLPTGDGSDSQTVEHVNEETVWSFTQTIFLSKLPRTLIAKKTNIVS